MQIERQAGNICVWSACLSGLWKRQRLTKIFRRRIKTKLLQSGLLCSGFVFWTVLHLMQEDNKSSLLCAGGHSGRLVGNGNRLQKKAGQTPEGMVFWSQKGDVHKNHLWTGFHRVESHHLRCSVSRVGRYFGSMQRFVMRSWWPAFGWCVNGGLQQISGSILYNSLQPVEKVHRAAARIK